MKQISKKRLATLLLLDLAMIAAELHALGTSWQAQGTKLFRYYTQDSNLLALGVCILCLVQGIRCLTGKRMPRWVRSLRYYSACCLLFTLLVAGFLLTPVDSDLSFFSFMLEGKYLFNMIDTDISLELLARLYSSQLITRGDQHLLDHRSPFSRHFFRNSCLRTFQNRFM